MTPDVGSPAVIQSHRLPAYSQSDEVEHSSINWRAIFAGTFISLLTYLILMSLGLALGGSTLRGVIQAGESAEGLGWGAGIWTIVTALISLFVGAYSGSRVSGLITTRIGRVQGAVITALFFAVMLSQLGSVLGSLGSGLGSIVGGLGGAASDITKNPQVQNVMDEALADLNLKSSPEVVAQGLATRLVRGDSEGAKNYLARQAGISPQDADQRLSALGEDVQRIATEAGTTAARVTSIAGWTLFGSLLLGALASILGGGSGAAANLRRPITRSDEKAIENRRVA